MAEPIYELVIGLMTKQYTCILGVPGITSDQEIKIYVYVA